MDDTTSVLRHLLNEWDFDAFIESTFRNTSGPLGRPIPVASFIISGLLHGNAPWGFKYHNLLIHLLIGIALFIFIVRLALISKRFNPDKAYLVAAISAGLWLLHPLHVSTILYAVQRMAQLSALFVICALTAYLYGRQLKQQKHKLWCYLFWVPLFSILGALSKENAALIPLFLIGIELYARKHLGTQLSDKIAFYALSVIPVIAGTIGLILLADNLLDYSNRFFNVQQRLLTQIDVVCLYLKQVTLPRLADMGLFLDDQPIRSSMDAAGYLKLLFLIGLISTGIWLTLKGSLIGLGIVFFFIGHAMESTVIPLELVFEHRNYLPSAGLLLATSTALLSLPIHKTLRGLLTIVYTILFAGILFARVSSWTNLESILAVSVNDHPKSPRAQVTLANFYMDLGQVQKAMEHIHDAKNVLPNEVGLMNVELLVRCGRTSIEEKYYNESLYALENYPLSAYALNTLYMLQDFKAHGECPALSHQQIVQLVDAAIIRAESIDPTQEINQFLYVVKARTLFSDGKVEEAISNITHAFNQHEHSQILFEMLEMLVATGNYEAAEELLRRIEQENLISFRRNRSDVNRIRKLLEKAKAQHES